MVNTQLNSVSIITNSYSFRTGILYVLLLKKWTAARYNNAKVLYRRRLLQI